MKGSIMGWKLARQLAAVVLLGAVAGGITGLLARLAMRLLAATSPPIAQRRLTDDLARVGEITVEGTAFVVAVCAVLGAIVSVAYLVVRRIMPSTPTARIAGFALLTGVTGGAILVHDEPSFDYTVLQPTWLAVLLFIAVPTVYGVITAALAERYVPSGGVMGDGRPLGRSLAILGRTAYVLLVLWGSYGLTSDIISLAMDKPSNLPLTL